jgi:hypothetical protein
MFLRWIWLKIRGKYLPKKHPSNIAQKHPDLIGEWQSLNGYYLIIQADNQAAYRKIDYLNSFSFTPQWGKLTFMNNVLMIRHAYSQKYFYMDKFPFQQQGQTCMVLNGMLFTKIM